MKSNNESMIKNYNELNNVKSSRFWDNIPFICITNLNWSIAASYDWCSGDGTQASPYIIENITIDASNSPTGCGIAIVSSNKYCIIRNCTVYNSAASPGSGIGLLNVTNAQLINNYVYNNEGNGIGMSYCNRNNLTGNYANNNGASGIHLYHCNNSKILSNGLASNKQNGIQIEYGQNNIISLNTAIYNIENGINLESEMNDEISHNYGQNNEENGIRISNSNINYLLRNRANSNGDVGIMLSSSNFNTVIKNTVHDNDGNGIGLADSDGNKISENEVEDNDTGICLVDSDDNNIQENEIRDHEGGGIWLEESEENEIRENEIKNNEHGIGLEDSDNNDISKNDAEGNTAYGVWLEESDNNDVQDNDLRGNNKGCFTEIDCKENNIKDNRCEDTLTGESIFAVVIAIVIMVAIGISIYIALSMGAKKRKKKQKKLAKSIEMLKEILRVSDRIQLERVKNILNLDDIIFNKEIIKWAKEFGFKIDGDYLITQGESIDTFINALEKQFTEWEKMEKIKEGKVEKVVEILPKYQELEKIKDDLKQSISTIENLIQTKEFSKAIDELENVRNIAKQYNFEEIISSVDKNLVLYANLKKSTKKDIQQRYRKVKDLIREKQFTIAIKELNIIIEQAKFQNLERIVKQATNKLLTCQELEKTKADLERSVSTIENLIQTKDFLKAIDELRTIHTIAKKHKFKEILGWIDNNLDLCRNLLIKKTVLELGTKFGRIQTQEISERTNIKDEKLIITLIQEMIENKEIYAEYFSSSKSLLFNQDTKIEEIDKLMATYKEWEEKKKEKKI